MFDKKHSKLFAMEKDTGFANRILALSLPSALVFIMLVALKLLPASIIGAWQRLRLILSGVFLPQRPNTYEMI